MPKQFITDAEMAAIEGGVPSRGRVISDDEMAALESGASVRPVVSDTNGSIGLGRAAVQGLARGAADVAGAAANSPVGMPIALGAAISGRDPRALTRVGKAREVFERLMGPYLMETENPLEAAVQGGARGAVNTIPTLGYGAVSPALSIVSGALGGGASEAATSLGAHPALAAGIGVATSMAASGAGSGIRNAVRGRRVPFSGSRRREAAELAAAADLRGAIGGDAVDDAVGLLRAEDALGPSMPGHARTAQVLADRAPGMVGFEAAQARRYPALQASAAARLAENRRAVNVAEDALSAGSVDDLVPAWKQARDASQNAVRDAYAAVDPSTVGPVSAGRLKSAAAAITVDAGEELSHKLPSELRVIERYGDEIDFGQLQRVRTSLSDTIRGLSRDPGKATDLRYAKILKSAVDETIDDLAQSGNAAAPALREAISARASHGRLFDPKHPAVRALEKDERAGAVVASIASGGTKRPTEEARRVLSAVGEGSQAHEGMKRLWLDRALGGKTLWEASPDKATQFLEKNAAASRVILGNETHATTLRLLERSRQLKFGRVGDRSMALGTGSALPNSGEMTDAATSALSALIQGRPGAAVSVAAGKAWDWIVKNTTSDQRAEILNDALMNPKMALHLLNTVTPKRYEDFMAAMRASVARQSARQALATEARE